MSQHSRQHLSTQTSDEVLVQQALEGSPDAFNFLYQRHLPAVYKRVCFTIPVQDVEDVTQDIFMAVIQSLKNFRGEARFSTWLRAIANHRIADYYRRKTGVEISLDRSEPGHNPLSEPLEARLVDERSLSSAALDERLVLRQALSQLPLHYQEVLLLRFVEDLPFHEIAAWQDQSLEAAKSLFRRAVAALHKILIAQDNQAGP